MKFLVLSLAVFAVISSGYAAYDSSSMSELMQRVRERQTINQIMEQFEDLCPGKGDDMEEALMQVKECAEKLPVETKTACAIIRDDSLRCAQPVIDVLEQCLPEKAKEVPKFVFNSIHSGLGYICKSDGEHIFELGNQCVKKMQFRSARCTRRIQSKVQQYKKEMPSKSEFCAVVQSMKPCLLTHLETSCTNRITRESVSGFINALLSPCNDVSANEIESGEVEVVEME